MDINQQTVHYNELNGKQLVLFLSLAVTGVFVGLFIMTYALIFSKNIIFFLLALFSFIIGLGAWYYVEKRSPR